MTYLFLSMKFSHRNDKIHSQWINYIVTIVTVANVITSQQFKLLIEHIWTALFANSLIRCDECSWNVVFRVSWNTNAARGTKIPAVCFGLRASPPLKRANLEFSLIEVSSYQTKIGVNHFLITRVDKTHSILRRTKPVLLKQYFRVTRTSRRALISRVLNFSIRSADIFVFFFIPHGTTLTPALRSHRTHEFISCDIHGNF